MPVVGHAEEEQVAVGVAVFAVDASQSGGEGLARGGGDTVDRGAVGQKSKGDVAFARGRACWAVSRRGDGKGTLSGSCRKTTSSVVELSRGRQIAQPGRERVSVSAAVHGVRVSSKRLLRSAGRGER